jgi:hypothetical protein
LEECKNEASALRSLEHKYGLLLKEVQDLREQIEGSQRLERAADTLAEVAFLPSLYLYILLSVSLLLYFSIHLLFFSHFSLSLSLSLLILSPSLNHPFFPSPPPSFS